MSFCIQNGESADQALHRLLNERTLRARKKLTEPLGDSAIHEVRRELKRVRAVLDLAQAHVRSKDHRRWQHRNAALEQFVSHEAFRLDDRF